MPIALAAILAFASPLVAAQMNDGGMHSTAMTANDFDSGNLPPGGTFSFTFNASGSYEYHCHIHPYMTGWINVTGGSMMTGSATVNISGFAFVPRSLSVEPGTTVTWTNKDHTAHTVTGGDPAKMMGMSRRATYDRIDDVLAKMDARFAHLPAAVASAALAKAQQSKLFSQFTLSGGAATGKFVTFTWSDAHGTITGFRQVPWNETVFSSIALSNYTANGTAKATGAVFHARGHEVTLLAHDNPTAEIHVAEGDASRTVTFRLSPVFQLNVNLTHGRNLVVSDAKGAYHGHVVLLGNATATNTTGLGGVIVVTLPDSGSGVMFFAHPKVDTAASAGLHGLVAAASAGKLGSILNVADASGDALEDQGPLDVDAHTTRISHGHVTIVAASDLADGKLVFVNLPPDVIPQANKARLTINVSDVSVSFTDITGDDAATAAAAIQAVLAAGHGATVNFATNGTQVTVFVPHFSDQTIAFAAPDASSTTTSPPSTSSPATTSSPLATATSTPGFEPMLALAGLALVALAVRRRE